MTEQTTKQSFTHPQSWKFRMSFAFAIGMLLAGFIIEMFVSGSAIKPLSRPLNIYVGFLYASLLVYVHIVHGTHPLAKWYSSVPAAISSVCVFAGMVLLMGFTKQTDESPGGITELLGLNHVKTTWPFLFIQLHLLTSLGLVTLKRLTPFNQRNFAFFLSHFGLWLIVVSSALGAGDIKRLYISVIENDLESNIGVSETGEAYKLPFSLKLLDFSIDEYPPRIGVVNMQTNTFEVAKGQKLPLLDKPQTCKISEFTCILDSIKNDVFYANGKVTKDTMPGGCFAAYVRVLKSSNDTLRGWIVAGSYNQSPVAIQVGDNRCVALSLSTPERFRSKMVLTTDSVKKDTITLEVNSPHKLGSWMLYQTGYDQPKGKWSTLSVVEAMRDPWLPVVYVGIFLLLGGAAFLFWTGNKNVISKSSEKETL